MFHAIIKNVHSVLENKILTTDLLIGDLRITRTDKAIDNKYNAREINRENKYLYPGGINDLVHFRRRSLLFNRK